MNNIMFLLILLLLFHALFFKDILYYIIQNVEPNLVG